MGDAPKEIWVIWPNDGSDPVIWTKPCPFPVGDDGEVTRYVLVEDK